MTKEERVVLPTIQLISDSVGWTGQMIARAAASQFGDFEPTFDILTDVRDIREVETFLGAQSSHYKQTYGRKKLIVFYSLVNPDLCAQMKAYLAEHPKFFGVDLMSDAIAAIAEVSGLKPDAQAGRLHTINESYFRRVEALDFTIAHDDGAKPKDLTKADIVIIGVPLTGKTPVSIFLSQQGLRVANVGIDAGKKLPDQLHNVQPTRMFGLLTTPEILLSARKRVSNSVFKGKKEHLQLEKVTEELEDARKLMRQLSCVMIHTENRTAEETAQEILGYYMLTHPHA